MPRITDNPKDKVFTMRCTQDFLNTVAELCNAFGMNKTELIEHLVQYYPMLAAQECKDDDT